MIETRVCVDFENEQRLLKSPTASRPRRLSQSIEKLQGALQSDNYKRYFLSHVIDAGLNEDRMDLWGEYEQITDDDLINLVIPALRKSSWKTLDLRRCNITCRGVVALAKALSEKTQVEELCLGNIALGDDGVAALAASLGNMHIISLKLFDNAISDRGVTALAEAIPASCLRTLDLSNNIISDDGALELRRAIKRSSLQRLDLNMNNLTSFGADELIDAIKHSSLTNLSLKGNDEMMDYSRLYLTWVLGICRSDWYKTCVTLYSARLVPRLGSGSALQVLPTELLRRVMEALHSQDLVMDECMDEFDEDEDEDDRAGYEEDYVVAVAHHKRRCSSLSSVIMETLFSDGQSA